MEACDKEHLNISISNSEEKQPDSFNSSELDDAMNELLTQDIQEPQNDSVVSTEDDLLDMMVERAPKHSMQKLKYYTSKKILRRAKYLRKKNYYFIYNTEKSAGPSTSSNSLLRVKTIDSLNKLDEKTSQKIKKVINSGDLTIQRLNNLGTGKQNLLISKTNFITLNSIQSVASYESEQSSLAPESFPKAIVYPDTKKHNVQPSKVTDPTKMSFIEVFTKAAEHQIKTQKSINQKASKLESNSKSKARVSVQKPQESSKIESVKVDDEPSKTEPFKYIIPQNLLASQNTNPNKTDSNASTSKSHRNSVSSEESQEYSHYTIPERPQINFDLIDSLADYRVIARYLFNKLNIPHIDFDGTDDYINLYKLSRN